MNNKYYALITDLVLSISSRRVFLQLIKKQMDRLKNEPVSLLARALNDNIFYSTVILFRQEMIQ